MRLAPLRQHSAYLHPHGVIHIAGQHVFKTRCVCQGQRYPRHLLRPLISRVLIASLIFPTAHADIIADPSAPGQQQPIILETANGLPLVNIQTPSAAGVSHNTYQQFDVARPGAILNNSTQSVSTQLGGWVQANLSIQAGVDTQYRGSGQGNVTTHGTELIDNNNESIKQKEDWVFTRAKNGINDYVAFINNIYKWRIKSQPSEEKSRYLLERDQLLMEMKEHNNINKKNDSE